MNNNDITKLIEYTSILNDYQHGNYRLNNEEMAVLYELNKTKNLNLKKEVDKINNMSFSERAKYIEEVVAKKEKKEEKASSVEEQISLTFGVDSDKVKERRLKDGKKIYVFYDEILGRNVVLEDGGARSLISELEDIREENEEKANLEEDNTLESKRVNDNLEMSFIPIMEIGAHLGEIASFDKIKRMQLKFLIDMAPKFGIVAINLQEVLGVDQEGNIIEVYFDEIEKRPRLNNLDKNEVQDDTMDKRKNSVIQENKEKDNQLMDMLSDNSNRPVEVENNIQKENTSAKVLERNVPPVPQEQDVA